MTLFRTPVARGMFLTILGGICWGVSGTCGQFLFSAYGVDSLLHGVCGTGGGAVACGYFVCL